MFHADKAIQPTPGNRGSTTRRKSTRTVRGAEGTYIAQCKEEAGPKVRPAPLPLGIISTAFLVECPHPSNRHVSEYDVNVWWFDTEAEAREKAAGLSVVTISRKDTVRYIPPGKRKPRERTEWTRLEG